MLVSHNERRFVHTFSLFATPTSVAADTVPFGFAWESPKLWWCDRSNRAAVHLWLYTHSTRS